VTVVLNSALSKAIKYRFKTIIYYPVALVDASANCWPGAARRQSVIAVVKDFPGVRAAAGIPQMRDRRLQDLTVSVHQNGMQWRGRLVSAAAHVTRAL
jgi:hypothetical protein